MAGERGPLRARNVEDGSRDDVLGATVAELPDRPLTHLIPVDRSPDPALAIVGDVGADRVEFLLPADRDEAEATVGTGLEEIDIGVGRHRLPDRAPLPALLEGIDRVLESADARQPVVNMGAAGREGACAALMAGYMRGLRVLDRVDGRTRMLPTLKLTYREDVSEAKLEILQALDRLGGRTETLRHLAREAGISDSLASYHIRGGREGPGLEELGLVSVDRQDRGRLDIELTLAGQLVARRLIPLPEERSEP